MGLRTVGDLFNQQGSLKTSNEIKEDYGLSLNFIDYNRLIRSIPQQWQLLIRENAHIPRDVVPWCQSYVEAILSDNKSEKILKKDFKKNNKSQPTSRKKWCDILLAPDDDIYWSNIYK